MVLWLRHSSHTSRTWLGTVGCKPKTGRRARLWWALQLLNAIDTMQERKAYRPEALKKLDGSETERGKSSKLPLDLQESDTWFRISDTHCDALILQKLHALGMSHKLPSEVSINAFWLSKSTSETGSPSLYSLRAQKLQVATMDAQCPRSGVWTALFLLQKRWMSFRASPKTQGASTGPEKRLGHGLDTSWGLVGPSLQEHSLRIAFCVAWCTMWPNVCHCRYHLSHSQLLLATHASLSYATLGYSTLFSFSGYSTLSYSHLQLLDSC